MGFFGRLLRREAEVQLVLRDRQALLRFRYGGGLTPLARILEPWPELAPLAAFAPQPARLETAVPPEALPALLEALEALARDCAGERRLGIAVAEGVAALIAPEAPEPEPAGDSGPRTALEPAPAPDDAPGPAASEAFFRDARALLDRVETDGAPVPLRMAYPRYDALSPEQLRWYLTLRGRLRAGEAPDAAYPYLLLYVYELVNGLGTPGPEAGLEALCALWRGYRGRCPELAGAPARWIWDFSRVHGVGDPAELLEALPGLSETVADAMLTALEESGEPLRLPVWLLARLSGHDISGSPLVKGAEDPGAVAGLFTDAVAYVDEALRRAGGQGVLSAHSAARLRSQPVTAFLGAPMLSERRYTLRLRRYHGSPRLEGYLNRLLRHIENGLRAWRRCPGRLKAGELDAASQAAVEAFLAQLPPLKPAKAARPGSAEPPQPARPGKLTLDMDSVLRLRAESDAVREALLASVAAAEESQPGPDDGPIPWGEPAAPVDFVEANAPHPAPMGRRPLEGTAEVPSSEETPQSPGDPRPSGPWHAFLDRADREALSALLEGPDALRDLARRRGRMPDALLDALNEAAADTLGDILADADGIYEEYEAPLREALRQTRG